MCKLTTLSQNSFVGEVFLQCSIIYISLSIRIQQNPGKKAQIGNWEEKRSGNS